jgi:hypothetical protein
MGHSYPAIAFNRYRLAVTETSSVATAPHAARLGRVGCGGRCAGAGTATYPVHVRPSQNRTAELFHGSGNQPVGVGNIGASVVSLR